MGSYAKDTRAYIRLVFLKERNKKITPCGWGPGPDDAIHKNLKPAPIVTSPTKCSNPKLPVFLNRNYKTFRIFREGLNCSLAQSPNELYLRQLVQK